MYYALIIFATILFSLQLFFVQGFQRENGSSLTVSMKYTVERSLVSLVIMLFLTKFRLQFTWFSAMLAFSSAAIDVIYAYFVNKSLKTANLSVYSVFNMLGGMLLPFIYGILFFGESFTWGKAVCCVLIAVSLVMNIERNGKNRKAFLFYITCFILNGLYGVLAKTHQSGENIVNSQSFVALIAIFSIVLGLIVWLFTTKGAIKIKKSDFKYAIGSSGLGAIGNLILLAALKHVDASVQYPLVTGGIIVFSAIATLFQEKTMTKKSILAVITAFLATLFVIF